MIIDYPLQLNTNRKKLSAVYSVIEQMRLEHNKVAEAARSDWGKYRGKFKTYAGESKAKLKKLLAEQNRLKENIRWSTYTLKEWKTFSKLPPEELDEINRTLFGDKGEERIKPTKATSYLLDELKTIKLDDLVSRMSTDPTEDLTGYTEEEPENKITTTTDRATYTDLERDETAYLYYDKTADHFNGNFEHLFKTSVSSGDASALVVIWALANLKNDRNGIIDVSGDELDVRQNRWQFSLALDEIDGGSQTNEASIELNASTVYFCEVERDEAVGDYGTIYLYICTGNYWDDGGVQIDSLSVILHTSKKDFQYIYAIQSHNSGHDLGMTGYMELLDLQEAVAPEVTVGRLVYGGLVNSGLVGGRLT